MSRLLVIVAILAGALLQGCAGPAATTAGQTPLPAVVCSRPNTAVGAYYDLIGTADPEFARLVAAFPKGGDIHNHLSGAVPPEDYIDLGAGEGACFGPDASSPGRYAIRPNSGAPGSCAPGDLPLARATAGDRERLVASLSMYRFDYPDIQAGHDQFFATFGRFGALSGQDRNMPALLVKLLRQADRDNVGYVETMVSFRSADVGGLATRLGRACPSPAHYTDSGHYPAMFDLLLAAGLGETVTAARREMDRGLGRTRELLRCGSRDEDPACGVALAFQASMNRNSSLKDGSADLAKMFAQAAFAFLLADSDSRVVGVNLVSGEDLPVSMENFSTQMGIVGWFHDRFPRVNIALHGGELTPCFVGAGNPALKEHLTGSIRAGAKRIGHGVSFAYLDDRDKGEVAALMKGSDTLVEIPFTSNAQILGVAGDRHPFPDYLRRYGVPVALATDDEGVSHSDFTAEWLYAFLAYGLTYDEAVRLARASIQYGFLAGTPLWRDLSPATVAEPCAGLSPGGPVPPGSACAGFLAGSPRASVQWAYEARLARFDRDHGPALRSFLGHRGSRPAPFP